MDPGPANIGIAKGVSETSDLVSKSAWTLALFIPLCLVKEPVNKANPDVAIINPPATRNEVMLIPKKLRTYFPAKNEIKRMIHTLIEVQSEVLSRLCFVSSLVNPTKTGTVPKGFKTENKAAKTLINNSIFCCKIPHISGFPR